ncbi:MAG: hypothetical protein JSS72_13020 [Armatimonadetes bacterium]|nr:hypothetical protein [Armatimonadota bacterium]
MSRKSASVRPVLLIAVASAVVGCNSYSETRYCTDATGRVLADGYCSGAGDFAVSLPAGYTPPVHWVYMPRSNNYYRSGSYLRGYSMFPSGRGPVMDSGGTTISNDGRFNGIRPAATGAAPGEAEMRSGVTRGGFGGFGSSMSGAS